MKPLLFLTSLFCLTGYTSAQQRTTKALVVGISQYQDTSLLSYYPARRDAEEYAALLQTVSGGNVEREQIYLLTDQQATLAGFLAALEWLLDEKPAPSKRLLYFAGSALVLSPGQKKEDVLLFFHDSPASPFQGNTLPLRKLRRMLEKSPTQTHTPFALTVSFKSPFETRDSVAFDWNSSGKTKKSYWLKWHIKGPVTAPIVPKKERSISSELVTGFLGLADYDGNMKIDGREIFRHLKNLSTASYSPGACFYMAVSEKNMQLSKVDERILSELQEFSDDQLFPPIVHLESMPAENRVLKKADPAIQQLYEDFILAIKVKNFLPPTVRNATTLYDSLLLAPDLKPITGYLRRRLAAAMLDDTQQALNAYLNTSSNEMIRRRKYSDQYQHYAQLLGKSDELLGSAHFMHKTLNAKRLYFEGLHFRLLFHSKKDSTLLQEALKKQLAAMQAEPEAAYIYNELGVVYNALKDTKEAQKQYLSAIEYSPTWSIPYTNLCSVSLDLGDIQAAYDYGILAVSNAPWNPQAYSNLADVCVKKEQWVTAETLYHKAIRLGVDVPIAYYNLACLFALKGDKEIALDWLRQSLEQGFDESVKLVSDPDLASIRKEPRFTELLKQFHVERGN